MGFMPIRYAGQRSVFSSPTTWLIIVNVIVFAVMLASGDFGDCNSFTCQLLAQENDLVMAGAYWQLFTSMFVHFGPAHILFNMVGLYYFGRINENIFSTPKFLTIYFVSGLLGSVMTLALLPPSTLSGGASGAIFGLVGSYVAIERSAQRMGFALVYAVVIFAESSFLPGVNIFAHLFGLIGGFALGMVFVSKRTRSGYSDVSSYFS
jgi:rhomboid protease GluP